MHAQTRDSKFPAGRFAMEPTAVRDRQPVVRLGAALSRFCVRLRLSSAHSFMHGYPYTKIGNLVNQTVIGTLAFKLIATRCVFIICPDSFLDCRAVLPPSARVSSLAGRRAGFYHRQRDTLVHRRSVAVTERVRLLSGGVVLRWHVMRNMAWSERHRASNPLYQTSSRQRLVPEYSLAELSRF